MVLALLALLLQAGVVPTSTQTSAGPSVQAMFDQATAAADRQDWAAALAGYEALERRLQAKPSGRSLALVRVRKGDVLLQLRRWEEARAALRAGYADLPTSDASLSEDRTLAASALGGLELSSFDFPAARIAYVNAVASAKQPVSRVAALSGLAKAEMFDDSAAALKHIDMALAEAPALPGITKQGLAQLRIRRGRVLLNRHDYAGARAELTKAMEALGGLSMKVDRDDVAVRSDLAIAALLAGDKEAARKYLAYTGAGRLEEAFPIAVDMSPPPCGGDAELRPDDVAVVEFGISDDGAVAYATPIYASRPGPAVAAFAKAVSNWSWTPDSVKKVKPFFRAVTRVQLRCSTAAERPGVTTVAESAFDRWLLARKVESVVPDARSDAARVSLLRAELASRTSRFGPNAADLVPVLLELAENAAISAEESYEWNERAARIGRIAQAPPLVRVYVEFRPIADDVDKSARRDRWIERMSALLAEPAIAADAEASATLRLLIAQNGSRRRVDRSAYYRMVAEDERLTLRDPLRVGALVRLASAQAEAGDLGSARASYAKTGLDAQQCALVDATPVMERAGVSSRDFPQEALRWGFEGWAKTEYDIAADGRTVDPRTVVAYPPFVFERAAVEAVKKVRYEQRYRPEGGLGCGGMRQRIVFQLPG